MQHHSTGDEILEDETSVPLLPNGEARSQYDVEVSSPLAQRSNLIAGIANMSNSIIGAGIIGLPYALSEAGFFAGVALLVVLCAVTDWTIRLIAIDAKLSAQDSYIGVMSHCFGRSGRWAVSFFQFIFACGGMSACGVIIGDTVPPVLTYWLSDRYTDGPGTPPLLDRRVITAILIISVAYPLSLHRNIASLAKASSLAVLSMFLIVLSVFVKAFTLDSPPRGSVEQLSIVRPGVIQAIGVISFAYVCHHNSLLIYGSLQTPTLDRFYLVTHVSTGISLVCCLILSIAGYLTFTDKTQGNILNNFSDSDGLINIARLCFGLNMFTTLPLEAFVCREVIETLLDKPFSYTRHFLVTTILVFSTMLIAVSTCDLGIVLEITGGLSATALAFIFPPLCYWHLLSEPWTSRKRLQAAACVIFGCLVMAISLILSFRKIVTGSATSNKQCN